MGWDNATEQTASVVDALQVLIRLTHNINASTPSSDDIPRVPRPYEAAPEQETISISQFNSLLEPQ